MAQTNGSEAVEEVPQVVNIKDGGAGVIKGETVSVRDGGAGIIQGKEIEMQDGGGMVVVADSMSIKEGGGAVLVANQADLTNSTVGLLFAKQVKGDPKVFVDSKAAITFVAALGILLVGLKLLFGRRR